MTQSTVSSLALTLCRAFEDDPALQRSLLEATSVDAIMAALSYSADAAFELQRAASAADTGLAPVAHANAQAAAAARQKALRLILMSGLGEAEATGGPSSA